MALLTRSSPSIPAPTKGWEHFARPPTVLCPGGEAASARDAGSPSAVHARVISNCQAGWRRPTANMDQWGRAGIAASGGEGPQRGGLTHSTHDRRTAGIGSKAATGI